MVIIGFVGNGWRVKLGVGGGGRYGGKHTPVFAFITIEDKFLGLLHPAGFRLGEACVTTYRGEPAQRVECLGLYFGSKKARCCWKKTGTYMGSWEVM